MVITAMGCAWGRGSGKGSRGDGRRVLARWSDVGPSQVFEGERTRPGPGLGRGAEQRCLEDVVVSCEVERSVHAIDNEGWDEMGQRDSGARSGIAAGEGRHWAWRGLGRGPSWNWRKISRHVESNGLLFVRLATR